MTILPQLERALFKAAQDQLPAPLPDSRRQASKTWQPTLRRLRASAAGVHVLLGIAVAIVIAVIALAAFKHGHQPASPAAPGSGIAAGTPPRQELIQTIGALRTPQSKADLNCKLQIIILNACSRHRRPAQLAPPQILAARWGYPALDRPLLRVVAIPAWRGKVLIAPTTYRPSAVSRRRTEGINLVIQLAGTVGMTGTGPRPTSVATFLAHGLTVFTNGPKNTNRGAFLVPDGVAKVTLGSFRLPPHSAPSGVNPTSLAAAASALQATATVNDNIAAVQLSIPVLTIPTASSGLYGMSSTAQVTWFNSSGQTVRRTTTEVDLLVRIRGRPSPTRLNYGSPPGIVRRCRPNQHAC